ncbi:MAG: DUF1987 domain-containing protein [Bacteroidales bacterium]|nr:DUF1987 domain-containing protein [Bacteroidales bacterium]
MSVLIDKTKSTPFVKFEEGILEISGRAIPEHSIEFFKPLINELERYISHPKELTRVVFGLEYANSGAKRLLMDICIVLEKLKENGNSVDIKWICDPEDDHMMELGKDIESLVSIPFKYVPR